MRTVVRWMAFGAGVGCASLMARAVVTNAAGVVAAVLSDFEARRSYVPQVPLVAHRTTRVQSTKLPPRLKADVAYARSAAAAQTIDLTEAPVSR